MKTTPGPWHVVAGTQIRSDKHQIARVWMLRNGEGVANARLIAAAPKLFKALKDVLDSLGALTKQHELLNYMSQEEVDEVFATIKQVEGVE